MSKYQKVTSSNRLKIVKDVAKGRWDLEIPLVIQAIAQQVEADHKYIERIINKWGRYLHSDPRKKPNG